MKKLIALVLALVMAFALIACESAPAATEPAAGTVDNYKELLIDSGYYTEKQLAD